MFLFMVIMYCDLNVKQDIMRFGICHGWINYIEFCCCKVKRYTDYEVEGDESGSDDEIVDYTRRCCIRYNHIKKLEARR